MEAEHCKSEDWDVVFEVPNYGTETTSYLEYWFVRDPTPKRLKTPELKRELEKVQITDDGGKSLHWPCEKEGKRPKVPREPVILKDSDEVSDKQAKLRAAGHVTLLDEELVGARLYTGPMYAKYNTVLRDIGRLRHTNPNTASLSAEQIKHAIAYGNLYTTTLHVINSAVIKLSKLTSAAKVYRGISSRTLPSKFRKEDEHNVRGGIEFGFTSCSTIREEALKYATQRRKGGAETVTPILLEMQMGMIDRGADLSWISQAVAPLRNHRVATA